MNAIKWEDISSPSVAARVRALPVPTTPDGQPLYEFIFKKNPDRPAFAGIWKLTMNNCFTMQSDGTPVRGHWKLGGMMNLRLEEDNTIRGRFSANNWIQCADGDVIGKIDADDNVVLKITCGRGACLGSNFSITGKLSDNGRAIRGKNEALPDRPARCIVYISNELILEKQ